MANKLQWVFEMVDKLSSPAERARGTVREFFQTIDSGLTSLKLIGEYASAAGRMISAGMQPAISREKTLGAFETLLGSAEEARKMYGQAVKFAAETPFETSQVVDSFQRLLTAKFDKEEVPIALRIIGDAASMQEDSQEAVQSVTRALSQIRSKGKLQGEELMQIQEAVPIRTEEMYEKLGRIYGVNTDRARKMQEAGKIDAQAASYAILEQLSEQFAGNMLRASTQIGGILSTLEGRPSEFLAKLQDTAGYSALRDVLNKMANAFDPEQNKRLSDFISMLGSGALDLAAVTIERMGTAALAFADGFETGLGTLDRVETDAESLKRFADNMRDIGNAAGFLSRGLLAIVGFFSGIYDWLTKVGTFISEYPLLQRLLFGTFTPEIIDFFTDKGAEGTAQGTTQQRLIAQRNLEKYGVPVGHSLTDVERSNYASLSGLGRKESATEYLKTLPVVQPLNVNIDPALVESMIAASDYAMSPEDIAEEYDLPQMARGGIVRRPTLALIGEAGPEAVVPLPGKKNGNATGQSIVVNAPITITISSAGAESTAESVAAAVESHLYSVIERLALQSGRYA